MAAVATLMFSMSSLTSVYATTYYSTFHAFNPNNGVYNNYVSTGNHRFIVDGVLQHTWAELYYNGTYIPPSQESWWGNGYYDPTFDHYIGPGDTIKIIVYNADNLSILEAHLFTVDTTPPNPPGYPDLSSSDDTGRYNDDNLTKQTSGLTFSWSTSSSSDVAKYLWRLDSGSWNDNGLSTSKDISAGEGGHTFYVCAVDGSSNTSTVRSLSFTVDTTAPSPPTPSAPSGDIGSLTPNVTWSRNGSWKYQALVDYWNGVYWWEAWTSSETTGTSMPIPSGILAWGSQYRSAVKACDAAGNWSGWGATVPFRPVESAPPKAVNPSPSSGVTSQPLDLTLSWQSGGGTTASFELFFWHKQSTALQRHADFTLQPRKITDRHDLLLARECQEFQRNGHDR
jgi:hypothetical protein